MYVCGKLWDPEKDREYPSKRASAFMKKGILGTFDGPQWWTDKQSAITLTQPWNPMESSVRVLGPNPLTPFNRLTPFYTV